MYICAYVNIVMASTVAYARAHTYLGDADVLEVPALEAEELRAGDLVLLEGVAVHGQAD